ncbi:hypothetical protein CY35_10G093600 [Sphagnum magellanicum]|nr:hypothetical protein CY35_10G093600 [Sphagnum magellanicum]
MEDVDLSYDEDHDNVNAVVEKGEYELARDANAASIAYLLKPLEEASKQLRQSFTIQKANIYGHSYLSWVSRYDAA